MDSPREEMLFGLLQAILPFVMGFVAVWLWQVKYRTASFEARTFLGPKSLFILVPVAIGLWLVPYGILLLLPMSLLLSYSSPAGRHHWKTFKEQRVVFISVFLVVIMCSSMLPVSAPKSPDSWGSPLFTENSEAPLLPASEQYTWLLVPLSSPGDVTILQSFVLRSPHQYGPFGQASSMLEISSIFGLEQARLHQAIELLDQRLTFVTLEPDEMNLEQKLVEKTHTYATDDGNVELDVRIYNLRSLALGIDEKGEIVGEVVIVAQGRWGGEVDMLVVVRPLSHSELLTDPFAERYVKQWIQA